MTQTPVSMPKMEYEDHRVIDTLHQSFTTVIYKAYDDSRGKLVSIKTSFNEYPSLMEINGLQHEFTIMQKLMNPEQIQLQKWHQKTLLIYDFFEGKNLTQLHPHTLNLEQFFSLAQKIAQKLSEIQEKNIIHKCLNPHNILYNSNTSEVKIIDFGLAIETDRESQQLSTLPYSDTILPYISPEQTGRINRYLDYRSDFYSLGMTFYRLLTGITPFHADNVMGWIHSHIAHKPLPMNEINPAIPEMVNTIIQKMIAKNSEDRYQDLAGLIYDLSVCQRQYKKNKKIVNFAIGRMDRAKHFQISQKIYGRDQELQVLAADMNEVLKGKRKLLTISGTPGIGKTALVQEFFRSFDHQKITLLQGKFEQSNYYRPYSALIDAINGLIKNILCENDKKLDIWRQKIFDQVRDDGTLMLEFLPELEKIIGKQKKTSHHSVQERQIEFFQAMERLIILLAHQDQSLVLFLDDLQWSDAATRDLISKLISNKELQSFYLILAYRDNVSDYDNTFLLWLNEIDILVPVKSLVLTGLNQQDTNRIIASTLNTGDEEVKSLTEIIYSKTKGSPFFITELLSNLYQNGYIYFSSGNNYWQWNIVAIRQLSVCDNVVDFMISRLKDLPEKVKLLLLHGACIGTGFDLENLTGVCDMSATDINQALTYAVKENILVPLGHEPNNYTIEEKIADRPESEIKIQYQFQHDRVQQAAYRMLTLESQQIIHYKIANFLQEKLSVNQNDDLFISLVDHYNKSLALIDSDQEKYYLAEMNSIVAHKMEATFAFTSAKIYLEMGLALLKNNQFPNSANLTLKLQQDYFYILYLCKDIKSALSLSHGLLQEPLTKNDRAQILYLCCMLYNYIGENEAAMDSGLKGLACLEIPLPQLVRRKDVIKLQYQLDEKLVTHPLVDFIHLPLANNPSHELILQILAKAYLYTVKNYHLCNYLILTSVELCLSKGLTSNAPFILMNYAQYTGESLHDWKKALVIAEIAITINKKIPNPFVKCSILFRLIPIYFWNRRYFSYDAMIEEIKDLVEKYGGRNMYCFSALDISYIASDLNLSQQIERGNTHIRLIKESNDDYVWPLLKMVLNQKRNLANALEDRFSLDDKHFKIQDYIRKFREVEKIGDTPGMSVYHLCMLQLCYIFGKDKELYKHIRKADITMLGDPFSAEHCFYTFMALSRIHSQSRVEMKKQLIQRMEKELKSMKSWSENCPQRFLHRYLLMEAEMASRLGKLGKAQQFYNQAIRAAHENDFIFDEAFINEHTVRFLCTHYSEKTAFLYLRNAHYLYQSCGAFEIVKYLHETYPQLINAKPGGSAYTGKISQQLPNTIANTHFLSQDLDIISLSKTVSALSEEVVLENLLNKLMHCIHENSGAEKCLLLLKEEEEDTLLVQAEISIQGDMKVMQNIPYDRYPNLSISIIQYVIRSQDTVLLGNAAYQGNFINDPAIQQEQTKSLLCLPIINQQKLIGILYLNNNLTTHAFSINHLEILKILIAQAAITIRNAKLYYNLEKKVAERTKEINKLNLRLKERIVDRTEKLAQAQQEILAQEYKCELADITSGTLHNVKNILNSIKVSGEMIRRNIKGNSFTSLKKANSLLRKNIDSLEEFICDDPKGEMLMKYYLMVEKEQDQEIDFSQQHLDRLDEKIDAIEKIVVTQQGYSGTSYLEELALIAILEDALIMQSESLERNQIKVEKQFQTIPPVIGIKTKVMHILINLIKNASEAMVKTPIEKKLLNLSTYSDKKYCYLRIQDSGCGIDPENLEKLFTHGFTTKKNGHGFGLYSCAAYMREMKGSINLESEGIDKGAAFILQFSRK